MDDDVTLRTTRLVLRPMTEDDAEDLHEAVLSRPEVMRWLAPGRPVDRAETELTCRAHVRHWRDHGLGDFAVREATSGHFLGRVGFRCRPDHGTDLGFALAPAAQGRGVGHEAGAACLDHAFGSVGLAQVQAFALPDNRRSIALLERLGAVDTGTTVSSGNLCRRFTFRPPG